MRWIIVILTLFLNACTADLPTLTVLRATPASISTLQPITNPSSLPIQTSTNLSVAGNELFIPAQSPPSIDPTNDPTILRRRFVQVRFELLPDPIQHGTDQSAYSDTLMLNLFDDASYNAVKDTILYPSDQAVAWTGHLTEIPSSEVILVITRDGVLSANISLPGAVYHVRFAGSGLYSINQINQNAFPRD